MKWGTEVYWVMVEMHKVIGLWWDGTIREVVWKAVDQGVVLDGAMLQLILTGSLKRMRRFSTQKNLRSYVSGGFHVLAQ